jgi:hypothetical protein
MKLWLTSLLVLLGVSAQAQITNYLDWIVSSNLTVTANWAFGGGLLTVSTFDGNGLSLEAPIGPQITMNQVGTGAHTAVGPANFYLTDGVFVPAGTVYSGFWMDYPLYLSATPESLRTAGSATFQSDMTVSQGASYFHAGGISTTQSVMLVFGGSTNVWTNAFVNGLLIASGPAGAGHASSLILPGGGYLLQPNGGTFLLP